MSRYSRRQILSAIGISSTLGIAGCSESTDPGTSAGTPTDTGTPASTGTPAPATPSAPQGNATVATSSLSTESTGSNSMTVPVSASVDGQTFDSVTVTYDSGFDLSGVVGEEATVYVGEGLSTAQTVTVTASTVTDDGSSLELTLDGSVTLADGQQVVVEYEGVRMPDREGTYAVTITLNGTASETGTVEITRTAGPIASTFETTIEGWRVSGDAQGGSSFPNHPDSGGNPGRCLEAVDDVEGGTWYWTAPAQFRGGKSDYGGGDLAFDIYQNNRSSQFSNSDVIIEGTDTTLVYDFGGTDSHPETDWTSYTVPLSVTDDWTVDTIDGEAATAQQFEAVLADVQRLEIRGEYVSGSDTGYLDNPTLAPPE